MSFKILNFKVDKQTGILDFLSSEVNKAFSGDFKVIMELPHWVRKVPGSVTSQTPLGPMT